MNYASTVSPEYKFGAILAVQIKVYDLFSIEIIIQMNTLLYSLFMISLISSADSTQPPSNHIFKTEGTAVNIGCLADIRHRNLTQISILKQRGESLVWCYTKKVDKKEKKRYNRIKHREEK